MGGSSKKQTVGYRYRMGLHLVLCQGPVDAVQEIQMGERTAWGDANRAPLSSGHGLTSIGINQPYLFGGDEREGGVVGTIDVLPGGPTQMRNDYLMSRLGSAIPAFRGVLSLLAAALLGFGWIKGAEHVQAQWDAAVQQQTLQATAIRERQAQATVKVVTQYVDRVRVVREKGDTIIREVPVYVSIQADAACTINRGFVRLHDGAAAGELPEPARDADAPAAGLALSAVAGTVAANYQTCHENAEQLRALQVWAHEMASAIK